MIIPTFIVPPGTIEKSSIGAIKPQRDWLRAQSSHTVTRTIKPHNHRLLAKLLHFEHRGYYQLQVLMVTS